MRWIRHLFLDHLALARAFPRASLDAIERAVAEQEKRHRGELRVAIEGGLPLMALFAGCTARERAFEHFARLRVWDTRDNTGVLIYLLLADRRVEIVADRGIDSKVSADEWQSICRAMEKLFAEGRYQEGAVAGVRLASELLERHFPAGGIERNELGDRPVLM
jgi:hypothetical protein